MQLIATGAELDGVLPRLGRAETLAADTEADGMFRYRARLCTIQIAAGEQTYIFDTLALGELTAGLAALFGAAGPTKIFHDVALDARMLHAAGVALDNVFDTQIAARFLGCPATGLGNLLEARFGVVLDKIHQQADWGIRPLGAELLRYLHDDVHHLHALAAVLREEIREKDIGAEVEEETRYVLAQAAEPPKSGPAWLKLRGAEHFSPALRGVASELCRLREAMAAELDVPAGRFLSSEAVLRMVELSAGDAQQALRPLPKSLASHAERFLEAIRRGSERGDAPAEELAMLSPAALAPRDIEARRKRRKLLTELRAREAAARRVDLQVVLPGHCLSALAAVEEFHHEALLGVRGFGSARIERYAARWIAELAPHWPRSV